MKVVYKEGDLVKVVEPKFVLRVGYPLSLEAAIAHCETTFEKEIADFCTKINGGGQYEVSELQDEFAYGVTLKDTRFFQEVLKAVAGNHLRKKKFGGKERTIHVESREDFRNTGPWLVELKRRVKTGTYEPGYTDYEGEYTMPYLGNEKTHTILHLSPQFDFDSLWGFWNNGWQIESGNVERIDNTKNS
jgi:hypothetical protein